MDNLDKYTVWITGASSGLGFYTAKALAKAGHLVIAGARSFRPYEGPCECGVHRIPLDVRNTESIRAFKQQALAISPRVDALYNCAGVLVLGLGGLSIGPVQLIWVGAGLLALFATEIAPWFKRLKLDFLMTPAQRISQVHAIEQLNALHPTQFEKMVQDTYRQLGYAARHIGQSGDHGVDLEVRTPRGERWVVQCKRWRDPVGEAKVRELYGTLLHEGAHRAVLVTSADITPPARAWARGKPIDLVDGPALLRMIQRAQQVKRPGPLHWLRNTLAGLRITRPQPPVCPRCKSPMTPHPTRPRRQNRTAYRCTRYPDCRVVVIR